MTVLNMRDFGAKGDGVSNDTAAVQKAIDAAAEAGGGVVEFPAGTFITATVELKSNVTVNVTPGAVWMGLEDPEAYPMIEAKGTAADTFGPWRAFIYAYDQENITLCGGGKIIGNGNKPCFVDGSKGNDPRRPFGLNIIDCRNVTVRDLELRHSAFWMQHYLGCDGLRLHGLKVYNRGNKNNDGVDIDSCRHVIVSDCHIDASDDALCFKACAEQPVEYVTVTNCILSSEASAFKLGTGSRGGFKHMAVSNCVIKPNEAEEVEHACQARMGMMGIDLGNVDGGVLEDIVISNIVIEGTETPIFLKLGARDGQGPGELKAMGDREVRPGVYKNVVIDNVMARDCGPYANIIIAGYPGNHIEDVKLSRIRVEGGDPSTDEPDFDVELFANNYPMNRIFNQHLPAYGLYVRYVDGIVLDDVRLRPAQGDVRDVSCYFENVDNLEMKKLDVAEGSIIQR